MDRNNGNTILLTVIGIATLLVALVGATFAYFTASINNENSQTMSVTTATPAGLNYVGGELQLPNALPGDTNNMTFTVTNPSGNSVSQEYKLKVVVDTDLIPDGKSFVAVDQLNNPAPNQLVVSISSATNGSHTPFSSTLTRDYTDGTNTSDWIFTDAVTIAPGEVHTYTLSVAFNNLENQNQNPNQGKEFYAHVNIFDVRSLSND